VTSTRTKRRYSPSSGPTRARAYDALRGMVSHEPGPAMKGSVCGLALVLGVIGCNSDKRAAIRSLQQYYECVTVAGPAANDPGGGNAGLKACLMGKGWNQDSAYAISGSVYGERMLVAGLTETAKHGRAVGDSAMQAVAAEDLRRALIASMKSGLNDLVLSEEVYFGDHGKYTAIVGCPPQSRGAALCLAEGNVLGPITLTKDGWTATMTRSQLPEAICAIFVGSTPNPPATKEGLPTCQ